MPMFKGEAVAERDSNFMTVQFYAAVAATQLGDSQKAIAALERAKIRIIEQARYINTYAMSMSKLRIP